MVGATGSVENATDLFIDAADGLRVINEVEQLAAFEWASCQTSQGVRRLLHGLRPGMTEREAVALLGWNGWPLSCHLMLTAGPRATFGLLSPGDRPIERGDPFTTAFGIWGALTCRAGFVAESAADLPDPIGDYVERLVAPYFAAIAEWYGAIRIGVTGGALHDIIARQLGDPFFGIFLNPGHQLHLDEWVNSPIAPGSTVELRSGMAFQVDVIPATGTEYFTTNIEDGIALADDVAARRLRSSAIPRRGRASRLAEHSWRTSSESSCTRTSCRFSNLPAAPAAVPPAAGSRDVDRRMTGLREVVLRSEEMEVVILPDVGGRIHRIRVVRLGHAANSRRSSRPRRRTVPLGCLRHVAVVQSSGAGDDGARGPRGHPGRELPGWHGHSWARLVGRAGFSAPTEISHSSAAAAAGHGHSK